MQDTRLAAAIALLLVTTALAGCLGGTAPGAGDEDPRTTGDASGEGSPPSQTNGTAAGPNGSAQADGDRSGTDLTLAGCEEQIGLFPLPAQDPWTTALPDGFEAEPFQDVPGTIALAAAGLACQTASHDGQDSGPIHILGGLLLVRPPPELTRSGAIHGLWIGGNTDDPLAAQALQGWGLNVGDGTFTMETTDAEPAARQGLFQLRDEGFVVSLATQVGPGLSDETGYDIRIFVPGDTGVQAIVDGSSGDAEGAWVGQADLVVPFPPPVDAGVAVHRWGESYSLTLAPGPQAAIEGDKDNAGEIPAPWWSLGRAQAG